MSETAWEQLALDSLGVYPVPGAKIAAGSGERYRRRGRRGAGHRHHTAIRDVSTENQMVHGYLTEGIRKVVYIDTDAVRSTINLAVAPRRVWAGSEWWT